MRSVPQGYCPVRTFSGARGGAVDDIHAVDENARCRSYPTPLVPACDGRLRRIFLVAASSGEVLLTALRTAAQPWRHELVFMSHTCCSQCASGSTQLGGVPTFAATQWASRRAPTADTADGTAQGLGREGLGDARPGRIFFCAATRPAPPARRFAVTRCGTRAPLSSRRRQCC